AWAASLALTAGLTWSLAHLAGRGDAVSISAPSRVIYDTMRGALSQPREEQGDPQSPIRLYEVPLPPGAVIDDAFADVDGGRVALPRPRASAEGYVTFALPSAWRNAGTLHL